MSEALTVPAIANFDHFKSQNKHFAHCSTVFMISGDIFYSLALPKVDRDFFKYFLDLKIVFVFWMGEVLTVPTIANFDHFKGQNTHFSHMSTVFVLSGEVFIP